MTAATADAVRSVAVAGDVTNSVIVTGDGVTVQLRVDGDDPLLAAAAAPRARPLPRPVHAAPRPIPRPLGRDADAGRLLAAAEDGAVELSGAADVGKTLVALHALHLAPRGALPDGEVYVAAAGKDARDILQDVHDALVETTPPAVLGDQALRRELAGLRALVVVDGHGLDRAAARAVRHGLPGCRLALVARVPVLGEGAQLALGGLGTDAARSLLEEELGRSLRPDEEAAATRACVALGGHPFRLRQAAAAVRDGRAGWVDVAAARSLPELLLEGLTPPERALVEQLATLQGRTLALEHLIALLGREGLAERVDRLCRARILASGSPRYRTAGMSPDSVVGDADRERLVARLTGWAGAPGRSCDELARELPALDALFDAAVREGRNEEATALGRAAAGAWAWERRWGRWGQALDAVLGAARISEDRSAEAWALHGLGTRAYGLGDRDRAAGLLRAALDLREGLGEHAAAAATRHNLEFVLGGGPPGEDGGGENGDGDGPGRWPRVAGAVALVAVLAAGALVVPGGGGGDDAGRPPPGTLDLAATEEAATPPPPRTGTVPVPPPTLPAAVPLEVAVEGAGVVRSRPAGVDCPPACGVAVPPGTELTLVPTARRGHRFTGWEGAGCEGTGACAWIADAPAAVTAVFGPCRDGGVEALLPQAAAGPSCGRPPRPPRPEPAAPEAADPGLPPGSLR